MKRLLAAIVVLGVIGVAIAELSSSVASARHLRPAVTGVTVTPGLKRLLQREILNLRAGQPSVARVVAPSRDVPLPVIPERVPCFAAGTARCPQIPCRFFANAPDAVKTSSKVTTTVLTCARPPRKLVPVSGR